ncbi:alpha/beta hydrolase [Candidatus Neomarinimicrobiota bacterium]
MNTQKFLMINRCLLVFVFSAFQCFAQENVIEEKQIQFNSDNLNFSGTIFVPPGDSIFPAIVILHGGNSNVNAHRSTSSYYAYSFAKKGIAALIFDKRGTGDSGGEFSKSTFDDYINDALNAIKFLKTHDNINPQQIGIFGPSQGGRIAALAAARSSDVAFIATISTPLVSVADLCYFSSMGFLKRMGITDSVKAIVDPLWKKHYASVEKGDFQGLVELDIEIEKFYENVDTLFLPLKSNKLDHLNDFRLGDFQPMYNSMEKDYITELSKVNVPWISIYAEFDEAVPVESSIKIMKVQMVKGGNKDYEIQIIPNVGHGFRNVDTNKYLRVEDIAIDWILNTL